MLQYDSKIQNGRPVSTMKENAVSLNIKDSETHRLAKALATETGETMTRAVTQALRERLERIRRRQRPEDTTAELLAIGRRCAGALEGKPVDHATLLYDERGQPR